MNDTEDDLDNDIRAALTGEPEPQSEPAPAVTEVDPANETPVDLPEDKPEEGEKTRERGPDGKFVAKAPEVEQSAPVQDPNAPAEPSPSAIRPPASWTPEAKSQFANLSPAVQAAVAKREQEIEQGLRAKDRDVKRYAPLEEVIAPHRQKWAVAGVDEATAVKQLLAASDWLERDPGAAIAYLAKQYGVNMAQPAPGQPQAQPAGISQTPEFTALQQELAALKQQIASHQDAGLQSQIDAFRNDPANLYFENVRDDMAVLINTGKAETLKDAYEMACWMNPEIRPLLQTVQTTAPDPAEVARKKLAGGSVTGSPAAPKPKVSNGSIEDDIRAAVEELRGAA